MPSNLKSLSKKLNGIGQKLQESQNISNAVGEVMFQEANTARNEIIRDIQNTKRTIGESVSRQKGKKRHFPSTPGYPPAIDTGNMIKSIVYEATDYKFIIGSVQTDPPYPAWLEQPPAKAKYEERPWLKPVINRREPFIMDELAKVIPDFTDKIFRKTI